AGPGELVAGDALLKLDRELAGKLDGGYRRGAAYLRDMQSLSSLAVGTAGGRVLVLFGALALRGAVMVLPVLGEVPLAEVVGVGVGLVSWTSVPGLGFVFFLLIHGPVAQRVVLHLLGLVGRGLYWTFFPMPRQVLRVRFVRRLLLAPPVLFFRRHLVE